MKNFKKTLILAKMGDQNAINQLLTMYNGLIVKNSIVQGVFDNDLHQMLNERFLSSIHTFRI